MTSTIDLRRQRAMIRGGLGVLAIAAWIVLTIASRSTSMDGDQRHLLTMGMGSALFLAMWALMMIAMMFPSAAPIIIEFSRLQATPRGSGRAYVSTAFFLSGYLAVWVAFGVIAFIAAIESADVATRSQVFMENGARIGGGVFILAGLYQLSALKAICLRQCRSPLDFVGDHWRAGRLGSVVMGVQHGASCLGCCWLLFVLLFPVGVMNIAAMALITILIFAEKMTPGGLALARAAGIAIIAIGVAVLAVPSLLPTQVNMGSMMM